MEQFTGEFESGMENNGLNKLRLGSLGGLNFREEELGVQVVYMNLLLGFWNRGDGGILERRLAGSAQRQSMVH